MAAFEPFSTGLRRCGGPAPLGDLARTKASSGSTFSAGHPENHSLPRLDCMGVEYVPYLGLGRPTGVSM